MKFEVLTFCAALVERELGSGLSRGRSVRTGLFCLRLCGPDRHAVTRLSSNRPAPAASRQPARPSAESTPGQTPVKRRSSGRVNSLVGVQVSAPLDDSNEDVAGVACPDMMEDEAPPALPDLSELARDYDEQPASDYRSYFPSSSSSSSAQAASYSFSLPPTALPPSPSPSSSSSTSSSTPEQTPEEGAAQPRTPNSFLSSISSIYSHFTSFFRPASPANPPTMPAQTPAPFPTLPTTWK